MKIVHVVGYFMPELGYQEYYLAKKQAALGHDVYVICSDLVWPFPNAAAIMKQAGAEATRNYKPGFYKIDGIKVYRLKHFFEYNDFILCKGIRKLLEEIKPDVVYSHESRQGMTIVPARYKKAIGYRYIVDQHDFYHPIPNHPWHMKILRWMDYNLFRKFIVGFNLKRADKIVPVTEETKSFLRKKHGIKEEKMVLIPLGVDTELFRFDEKKRKELRAKFKLGEKDIVAIFSGTIFQRKRIELLLEAIKEIQIKELKLIIVGDGDKDYVAKLKDYVKKEGLSEKVIFAGHVPRKELPGYFSAADFGIWPGNNSVAIIEAMSCRLAIVMVDLQLGHLVKGNGFKFKDNDKNGMISAIESATKADLRKLGELSYKRAMENYSYNAIAKRFIELAK